MAAPTLPLPQVSVRKKGANLGHQADFVTGLYILAKRNDNPSTEEADLARLDDIATRVAHNEGWLKGIGVGGGILVTIAICLGGWTLVQVNSQGKQITALQTYVTHQLPQIAANIISRPTDTKESATQNLDTARGIITNARKDKIKLNPYSLLDVSHALQSKSETDSNLPAYWQTAAELVTYRSQIESTPIPIQGTLPPCWDHQWSDNDTMETTDANGNVVQSPLSLPDNGLPLRINFFLGNCVIQLDDMQGFWRSGVWSKFERERRRYPSKIIFIALNFSAVKLVYRGGELIPFASLKCSECTLDFEFHALPPPRGQTLTSALLTANLNDLKVDLGTG